MQSVVPMMEPMEPMEPLDLLLPLRCRRAAGPDPMSASHVPQIQRAGRHAAAAAMVAPADQPPRTFRRSCSCTCRRTRSRSNLTDSLALLAAGGGQGADNGLGEGWHQEPSRLGFCPTQWEINDASRSSRAGCQGVRAPP